jgi:hypothetical protein
VNIVEILYTHVCKWKNETCCNYLGMGGGGIKQNDRGGKFKYDIRTFVNVIMYPQKKTKKSLALFFKKVRKIY